MLVVLLLIALLQLVIMLRLLWMADGSVGGMVASPEARIRAMRDQTIQAMRAAADQADRHSA